MFIKIPLSDGGNLYEEWVDGKTVKIIQDNNGDVDWPALKDKIDSGDVVPVDEVVSEKYMAIELNKQTTMERDWRDEMLKASDILVIRALEDGSSLSNLKTYRTSLRDWPTHADFKNKAKRPQLENT